MVVMAPITMGCSLLSRKFAEEMRDIGEVLHCEADNGMYSRDRYKEAVGYVYSDVLVHLYGDCDEHVWLHQVRRQRRCRIHRARDESQTIYPSSYFRRPHMLVKPTEAPREMIEKLTLIMIFG